ncbi:MAG: hypothetical protein RLZZ374_1848 [Cyanobacteriota bacterium]
MATPLVPERGCCEDIAVGIITTRVRHGKQKHELSAHVGACRVRADLRSRARVESSRTLKKPN